MKCVCAYSQIVLRFCSDTLINCLHVNSGEVLFEPLSLSSPDTLRVEHCTTSIIIVRCPADLGDCQMGQQIKRVCLLLYIQYDSCYHKYNTY